MASRCGLLVAIFGASLILISAHDNYRVKPEACKDPNAEYKKCGKSCQTCSNYESHTCNKPCEPGCFCKTGFLENSEKQCIEETKCRSCTGNTTYSTCTSSCAKTCENKDKEVMCTMMCGPPGCKCKEGFVVRNDKSKPSHNDNYKPSHNDKNILSCVRPKDCPSH